MKSTKDKRWERLLSSFSKSYGYGDKISHDYLYELFGIKFPAIGDFALTVDYNKANEEAAFKYLSMTKRLHDDLLLNFNKKLKSVRGEGYVILHPSDQIDYGYKKEIRDVRKSISESIKTVNHVNIRKLSDEERLKKTDYEARLSWLMSRSKEVNNK